MMDERDERQNVMTIGEVRKTPSAVLRVSIGEYRGRAYVYTQTWARDEQDPGEGEPTHGGMTLRPGTLRALMPLFEAALKLAGDERGR